MHLVLTTLIILSPSLSLAASPRGENLLVNQSFERLEGTAASHWKPFGEGYTIVAGDAQNGGISITCKSVDSGKAYGAMQEITFDPPIRHPFKVSGWSKAQEAKGSDYCLYMDCWYDDGTNLWGQRRNFDGGTHDWQYIEYVFDVEKPVTKIQYFILFRHCTGKVWFDNVSLKLVPFMLENERAIPGLYGGNSIDYSARLSIPATWKVSILRDDTEVYSMNGQGAGVTFEWLGVDGTGKRLVGGNYIVRLVARDKLLGEELRHDVNVHTKSGIGRGYVAWVESSMKRVLINSLPNTPNVQPIAQIALAGNEYESFQVALRAAPNHNLSNCTVELSDLKDSAGNIIAKSNIEWHQVGFVELKQLFRHPKMQGATPGWWPDPLLPVSKFDIPKGVTQSLWFTIYAPPDTPAGEYAGEFTIHLGNAPSLRVPVKVTIYGFNIPTEPHIKTAFALMDGFLEKIYGKLTPKLRRAYGDYVLKHRLNPDDISRTTPPDIEDIAHYYNRGLNAFNVINMVKPRGKRTWVCWSPLNIYTPEFKAGLIKRLDPYVADLKRRGLIDKAYVYTFDERGKEFWPVIKEYFGLIKKRYGIPTLTTAKVPQDPNVMKDLNVDWNCPVLSVYNFDKAEKCRKAGLEVWTYVCLGPRYPFANWLADDPLIEARVIWWQVYHQKIDGFLYWGLNIWSRAHNDYIIDPEKDGPRLRWSITTGGRWSALHGDGEMLYPGKDGPFGCIRLANIRDGIEDYEYLWLLAKLEGDVEKAREACLPITTNLTAFNRDPQALYAQREKIAKRIESMLKK